MRTQCLLMSEWDDTCRPRTFAAAAARLALATATLWIGTATALAQQYIAAESRHGYHTPLNELSLANLEPALTVPRAKMEELRPFFADTRFAGQWCWAKLFSGGRSCCGAAQIWWSAIAAIPRRGRPPLQAATRCPRACFNS
jgi:hypothetical protein